MWWVSLRLYGSYWIYGRWNSNPMTMNELFGWVEAMLRVMGIWDTMTAALSVMVIVALSLWVLARLRA